ncbi:glycosyltransferase 87 family protein [Aldersonia kunmingensis]|uniref:glycosyltransferase 87 family protein n=1 Tax=Aldersonia kunmingensis TaxID=408066 RepID=UPI000A02150C|nr:glycosyltransferase 87 family protein [Aldersonia kunmingensis]
MTDTTSPAPSAVSGRNRVLLTGLAVAGIVGAVVGVVYHLAGLPWLGRPFGDYYRIDLDVYRIGGTVFAHGAEVYGQLPPTKIGNPLPFTYPPLAAISFGPMSWVSLAQASVVMTALSLVALFAAIALVLRSHDLSWAATAVWGGGFALGLSLLAEPVYSTLDYGQVNLILMALVLADCLPKRTPWPRGLLIGFVAAFKLTPAVFVLYLLLRRDFRAVVVSGISFVVFTALGFVLAFGDSAKYWTEILPDSNRIGRPAYPSNQSITGFLARLGVEDLRTPLWLLAALAVLALAIVAMRRALAAGDPALALCANALAGLLISPVSWSHHWVWAIPILLTMTIVAYRRRSVLFAGWAVLGALMFNYAAHWRLAPGRYDGLNWPIADQLLASSYVWWGLGTLVILAFARPQRVARRSADPEMQTVAA